jgi:hypothetical protein
MSNTHSPITIDNIKILVCAHKAANFPQEKIFLPVQAGKVLANVDLGIQGDDTGENISVKNQRFCELTVLYWAWKNLKKLYPNIEYVGLCHYRRYFALDKKFGNVVYRRSLPVQSGAGALVHKYLRKYQVIASKPQSQRFSLRLAYCADFNVNDYRTLKQVVHELSPEYDTAFRKVYEFNNKMSVGNMFIARYDFLVKYCEWLFAILFETERRLNFSNYNEWQIRELGSFAEVLLNVYIKQHKIKVLQKPVYVLVAPKPQLSVRLSRFILNIIRNFFYYLYIKPSDWLSQYLGYINKPGA